jgi:hypothetical protein
MAVGGVGIPAGAYVTGVERNAITLAIPPSIALFGIVTNGSTRIAGLNSLVGLAVGQRVSVPRSWLKPNSRITAIDYADQSITVSEAATGGDAVPTSVLIDGTWTTDLRLVAAKPVLRWIYNASALHNYEGQMIGGSMHGVYITDPGFRTLTGVQGVEIFGWDTFESYGMQIYNLQGSALILGGVVPDFAVNHATVRESNFFATQLRDCGDPLSGQSSLEIITGAGGNLPGNDEINQISFVAGSVTFPYADGLVIGTYNRSHQGITGPRLLWFKDNFQLEGGSHTPGYNTQSQNSLVYLQSAGDVYFEGAEIAVPGYGKSLFQIDTASTLVVQNSRLYDKGKITNYLVSVTHGSPTIELTPGTARFDVNGRWDGMGALIYDNAHCAPCKVYLQPQRAVRNGSSLVLASGFSGATVANAKLVIGATGYVYSVSKLLRRLTSIGNHYDHADDATVNLLHLSNASQAFAVGQPIGQLRQDWSDFERTVGGSLHAADSAGSNVSTQMYSASLLTTANSSDMVVVRGIDSTSRCSLTATNALAANNVAGTYIWSKKKDGITVNHAPVAGMTFDIVCTAY